MGIILTYISAFIFLTLILGLLINALRDLFMDAPILVLAFVLLLLSGIGSAIGLSIYYPQLGAVTCVQK